MYVEELVDGVYKVPSTTSLPRHTRLINKHHAFTIDFTSRTTSNLLSTFYYIHTHKQQNDSPINLLRSIDHRLRLRRPSPLRMRQDNCRAMRLQQESCSWPAQPGCSMLLPYVPCTFFLRFAWRVCGWLFWCRDETCWSVYVREIRDWE